MLIRAIYLHLTLLKFNNCSTRSHPSPRGYYGTFPDLILFQYDALLFRNVNLSPEHQYALTKVPYPPTCPPHMTPDKR